MKNDERMFSRPFLEYLLVAVSSIFLIFFVWISISNLLNPFDLEWAEGASVLQVDQIVTGQQLFRKPSLDFIALPYTPLYFYLSALVAKVMGNSLFALRAVSIGSTVLAGILICLWVYRRTGSYIAVWVSVTLFAASFHLGEGFLGLARVDALYLLGLFLTIWVLIEAKSIPVLILGGILAGLCFFIKQTAILIFMPIVISMIFRVGKKSIIVVVSYAVILLGGVVWFNWQTGGWFSFYVFKVPSLHGYSAVNAMQFLVQDIFAPFGIAIIFVGLYFQNYVIKEIKAVYINVKKSWLGNMQVIFRSESVNLLLFFIFVFVSSWITRASNGGASNNVIPVYAVVSLIVGLMVAKLLESGSAKAQNDYVRKNIVYFALLVQFVGLLYNPLYYIRNQASLEANSKLLDKIKTAEEPVLIPYRSHLPGLVNRETQAHMITLFELIGYFGGETRVEGEEIIITLGEKIRNQEYAMIILDYPLPWLEGEIEDSYRLVELGDENFMIPEGHISSWQGGLNRIFVPAEGN
jgi:4-amino-4-deoxy-L-arabinose transferase-like glycosyltransferase